MVKVGYVNGAHGQMATLKKEWREYIIHVASFIKDLSY